MFLTAKAKTAQSWAALNYFYDLNLNLALTHKVQYVLKEYDKAYIKI